MTYQLHNLADRRSGVHNAVGAVGKKAQNKGPFKKVSTVKNPIFIGIAALSVFLTPCASEAEPIKVLTFNLPPLIGESRYSKDGLAIELLKQAFKASGTDVEVEFVPRERANITFLRGSVPIYLGATDSLLDAQFKQHVIEYPLVAVRNVIFYRKSIFPNFSYSDPVDLKKYSIGVLRGGATEKIAMGYGLRIQSVTSIDSLIKMLAKNRMNIAITTDLAGTAAIEENAADSINDFTYFDAKPFVSTRISIVVNTDSAHSKELVSKIQNGLAAIYNNGAWLSTMEKYYGKGQTPKDSLKIISDFRALGKQ